MSHKKVYVYAGTHKSFMDVPATVPCLPFFRYMAKRELGKIPLFGFTYRNMHVNVAREDKDDRKKSLLLASESLQQGYSMFLFPEGTTKRPKGVLLGEMKDGAFVLAIENQVPLVPVTSINTDKAVSADGNFLMRPFVCMRVIIDEPISTIGMTMDDVPKLKAQVEQIFRKNLQPYYPDRH